MNAVYGFLLILFKVLNEFQPTYVAAAFDVPSLTKRKEQFSFYKANRVKASDELYSQIPKVKEALKYFHVPSYEKDGFEADDLIGTLAKQAPLKQAYPPIETIIVSGDMDTLQLVDGNTKVYASRKGLQDTVLYDQAQVEKRYGIKPSRLPDYKGLRGDASDNIPGVKGIGEKTASQLLSQYGSLEGVYDNLSKLNPKLATKLSEGKEDAFLSRELATIDKNVPIDFHMSECEWKGYDQKEAATFIKDMGFQSLLARLPQTRKGAGEEEQPIEQEIERLYQDGILSEELYEVEKRLIPVLKAMEKIGIKVDTKFFQSLGKEMEKELAVLEKLITQEAGASFTVTSPKQLSEILFQKLQISSKGLKKTAGGVLSTASSELEKIYNAHTIIPLILSHRELQKLYTTYVKPFPLAADNKGRIHTTFHQLGTATGRMSSSSPNLQNIPVQGVWGKRIREGFIAEKEYSLVSFDYSQNELRIAAFLAKDPVLQQAFAKGEDVHRVTASQVFNVASDEVTHEMRYKAKALNFGILYGMGAQGFAKSAHISIPEAQDFIASYFARFPHIKTFMEDCISFAKEHGYAQTLFGRKRYLPDIHSLTPHHLAAAERMAINHPVQGGSADMMKMAMVKLHDSILSETKDCRLLLQIHDELIFECKAHASKAYIPRIKKIMEGVGKTQGIILKVEVKEGGRWGHMRPVVL